MKITIDERVLEKYGLTLEEFLFWYLCMRGYNIDNIKIDTDNKYILINGSTRRAI